MTDTLLKEDHYSLGNLIGDIGRGRIELHDNKRPFFSGPTPGAVRAQRASQSLPGEMAQPWGSE